MSLLLFALKTTLRAGRSKSEGYRVYVGVRQPERRADAALRLGVE